MVVVRKYFIFVSGVSGFPETIRKNFVKLRNSRLFPVWVLRVLWFLDYQRVC